MVEGSVCVCVCVCVKPKEPSAFVRWLSMVSRRYKVRTQERTDPSEKLRTGIAWMP